MHALTQALKAIYNFLVGDMRILIGATLALIATGLSAQIAPMWAGVVLFVLLSLTLSLALRREIQA